MSHLTARAPSKGAGHNLPAANAVVPDVQNSNKRRITQQDGQYYQQLDDVHEVVSHRQACHKRDDRMPRINLALFLCIIHCFQVCLQTQAATAQSLRRRININKPFELLYVNVAT